MSTNVIVTNNPDRQRYEAAVDRATIAGYVEYQDTSELVVLTHAEVGPAFEGKGIGSVLARAALDDVREHRLKALVICPFIIGWLRTLLRLPRQGILRRRERSRTRPGRSHRDGADRTH